MGWEALIAVNSPLQLYLLSAFNTLLVLTIFLQSPANLIWRQLSAVCAGRLLRKGNQSQDTVGLWLVRLDIDIESFSALRRVHSILLSQQNLLLFFRTLCQSIPTHPLYPASVFALMPAAFFIFFFIFFFLRFAVA